MRRILVTGAAGFIGSNFVRYWLNTHKEDFLVLIDALTYAGNRENVSDLLSERCLLVEGNINDADSIKNLLANYALTTIVHFAAETHVDRSIEEPDCFIETNILGTYCLLKSAKHIWLDEGLAPTDHRFHHVSTDEVFGTLSIDDAAFNEKTAYAPNSPYSASKASSDFLARSYHHTYGLNVTISNCSNNYGPYHFPEKLIPLSIVNLLCGQELPIYGNGCNVRDWLYVEDHAKGIERILIDGTSGQSYNIGGDNELANTDVVKLICQLMDDRFSSDESLVSRYPECPAANGKSCDTLIRYVTDRAGHDFRYAIDATRMRKELEFQPETTFETGIRKTLDWYLSNSAWWRAVQNGSYRRVS